MLLNIKAHQLTVQQLKQTHHITISKYKEHMKEITLCNISIEMFFSYFKCTGSSKFRHVDQYCRAHAPFSVAIHLL